MRLVVKWIIQPICRSSLTCCEWSYFLRVSSLAFFLFFLFVAAGSSQAVTYICRCLRSARGDHTIYDKRWVTWENGGQGGYLNDCIVYPQLSTMAHASGGGSSIQYWQTGFTASSAPFLYTVVTLDNLSFTVQDEYTNTFEMVMNSFSPAERSAINLLASQVQGDSIEFTVGYYREGTRVGNSVSGYDSDGNHLMSYPDSTGYVPSYTEQPQGGFSPVWYDISSTSDQAIKLNSLQNLESSSLQYDSDTGLYSFELPDYSVQLASINQKLSTIANRDVSFNPEIVVNPELTVTPEVTVNVNAPSQNDITVAIDNSDLIEAINNGSWNTWSSLQVIETSAVNSELLLADLSTKTDPSSVSDLDLSSASLSQEEQSLLSTAQGWNTQFPLIGNYCNFAFNHFLGTIPNPPRQLVPLSLELLGFRMVIDFTPYETYITWFRAFCLMVELIWFYHSIWKSVTDALKV